MNSKERRELEQRERLQAGVATDPNPNAENTAASSRFKSANLNDNRPSDGLTETKRTDRNNADLDVDGDANVGSGEKCPACNGTGAVVSELKDGRVEKWKNCPMCGAKGINPKRRDLAPEDCVECNGTGKVPESFVDGKLVKTKSCVRCKGTGRADSNNETTATNTASNVPEDERPDLNNNDGTFTDNSGSLSPNPDDEK